jgi:Allene oxide cyclase barrel like domain
VYRATICAALLLSAGAATAEQMTMYNVATGDHFVELGQDGGAGDTIVWNSDMEDEQGEKLGSGAGSCIQVDAAGNYMCSLTIGHDGHGTINASGFQAVAPATSILTIVGGTGAYEGITGTVRSTPVEQRARFRYEIDYRLD